jgi:transposase
MDMQNITTIGLDIAKSVFQVHGVDGAGNVMIRRKLKRRYVVAFFQKLPPCLVGMEACATSHYRSRELQAIGDTVRLMQPAYVKPYVKRQKNDAADAEAICEAVTRSNMRFVETKTAEQQSCLMLHRTRHQRGLGFDDLTRGCLRVIDHNYARFRYGLHEAFSPVPGDISLRRQHHEIE